MKKFAIALCIALGAALGGYAAAYATVSAFWGGAGQGATVGQQPTVNGPWLGDNVFNVFQLVRAHVTNMGVSYTPGISASQTVSQAGCTVLNTDGVYEIKTSAAAGAVCLPTALAGQFKFIAAVAAANTITLFSNSVAFGTSTDTINNVAGTTGYVMSPSRNAMCFAPQNGAWYCMQGN